MSNGVMDFDESQYDIARRLLMNSREINRALERKLADARAKLTAHEYALAERNGYIERLERGIVGLLHGPSSLELADAVLQLNQCPECHGRGCEDDTGACGDPECCPGGPTECAYCRGTGSLSGRWPRMTSQKTETDQ